MPYTEYLRAIEKALRAGNATEHTHRPALKALLEAIDTGITATNEPKRVQCGAPDFIVTRKNSTVGYIECKDIGAPFDKVERSEQLQRYLEALQNLILTDYLRFRHYAAGKLVQEVTLARPDGKGKLQGLPDASGNLTNLFNVFLAAESATIGTPKELAARMAAVAKVIREAVEKALVLEDSSGTLHNELASFRTTILPGMNEAEFADMYAQTVCYGLFSACANLPSNKARQFTREHAAYDLPPTNPFLRDIFDYIAGTRLDASIVWAVELLADILRNADMGRILKDFGKATRREDPVVHFYETFLAAYDPKLRETRGVYYTPEPVVSYIVRSIDHILKTDFDCPTGLADSSTITAALHDPDAKSDKVEKEVHRVQILDPAAGTGTFLFETVRHIFDTMKRNRGLWAGAQGYVAKHLLPRLFGFELMMAPYAVAHMKLGWLLKETGYNFPKDERLRVYLTNTLEKVGIATQQAFPFAGEIAREANAASRIKTECPIMVIMGNPPYSGLSANMNTWTENLLKKPLPLKGGAPGYYEVDGKPLGEKKVWLQDDYVKFIRFAQYRIELTGYGVLGFITNHAYLDNPTFRGMRQSLMHTFDDIYILDLHGNERKKETAPDGSEDKNVFDIMQGVAIGIFVKRKHARTKKPATVYHSEVWGTRNMKYDWLLGHDVRRTRWNRLTPNLPFYLFARKDDAVREEYERFPQVTDVLPNNVTGIVTARDAFVIDFDAADLVSRIVDFSRAKDSRAGLLATFDLRENYAWRVDEAQKQLRRALAGERPARFVRQLLYRPFDMRVIFYHASVVWRPRDEIMQHMVIGKNLAIMIGRAGQVIGPGMWDIVHCARGMTEFNFFRRGGNNLFPLYLYPNGDELIQASPWPAGKDGRRPNLSTQFVEELSSRLRLKFVSDGLGDRRKTFAPEDVFHYIYAIFHSPTYRARYAEFLKIDFPRVPLTTDRKLFARLCEFGTELVGLHLLEDTPTPRATYPIAGDNRVEKPHYKPLTDEAPARVYVNGIQYFDDVPHDVWKFHVGGYQVCEKWLKDRKGRTLTYDDIETYRKITEALRGTVRIMAAIDESIPAWPVP